MGGRFNPLLGWYRRVNDWFRLGGLSAAADGGGSAVSSPSDLAIFVDFSNQEVIFPGGGHSGCLCSTEILLIIMSELQSAITSADFIKFFSCV